jgi:hypothetical protein
LFAIVVTVVVHLFAIRRAFGTVRTIADALAGHLLASRCGTAGKDKDSDEVFQVYGFLTRHVSTLLWLQFSGDCELNANFTEGMIPGNLALYFEIPVAR